jgi:hypothetical protein
MWQEKGRGIYEDEKKVIKKKREKRTMQISNYSIINLGPIRVELMKEREAGTRVVKRVIYGMREWYFD